MKDEVILKQMRRCKLNGRRGERRALEKMKLVKWEGLDYLCHEVKK
jgi:hypothetical protein